MRRKITLIQFGVTLDPKLCQEIDKMRQDIPRSHVIERALIRYLNDVKNGKVTLLQSALTVGSHEKRPADLVHSPDNNHQVKEALAGVI